jgi:protocatechuate 3,4-dioxygenase beta subunit
MSEHTHDHDRGLSHDLPKILEQGVARRRMLGIFGGLAAAGALAACGTDDPGTTAAAEIPEETAGPYPGDGSNGVNVLNRSGVVRSDITASFDGAGGVADGVPLTIRMKVYDLSGTTTAALPGAAVYLWHCDRDGQYSMYTPAVAEENYLRGVQEVDGDGWVEFTSIFPGAYDGRWPHIHFEVYPSTDDATSASAKLRTSQLAFPQDVCETVYATEGYEASVANLARTSLESDMVFSDGYSLQLAEMTGSNAEGWVATLHVPV